MAWYDIDTDEIVDECNICEYIAKVYTMDDHIAWLKEVGMNPDEMSETDLRCTYIDQLDYYEVEMQREHDYGLEFRLGYAECRCNQCMRYFEDDNDLMEVQIGGEWRLVCPDCMTDDYIMDLE